MPSNTGRPTPGEELKCAFVFVRRGEPPPWNWISRHPEYVRIPATKVTRRKSREREPMTSTPSRRPTSDAGMPAGLGGGAGVPSWPGGAAHPRDVAMDWTSIEAMLEAAMNGAAQAPRQSLTAAAGVAPNPNREMETADAKPDPEDQAEDDPAQSLEMQDASADQMAPQHKRVRRSQPPPPDPPALDVAQQAGTSSFAQHQDGQYESSPNERSPRSGLPPRERRPDPQWLPDQQRASDEARRSYLEAAGAQPRDPSDRAAIDKPADVIEAAVRAGWDPRKLAKLLALRPAPEAKDKPAQRRSERPAEDGDGVDWKEMIDREIHDTAKQLVERKLIGGIEDYDKAARGALEQLTIAYRQRLRDIDQADEKQRRPDDLA